MKKSMLYPHPTGFQNGEIQANDQLFLRIDGLCKRYQKGGQVRHVLESASLEVAKGEFIAILGKSASGKTTLLNLISYFHRPGADCYDRLFEPHRPDPACG